MFFKKALLSQLIVSTITQNKKSYCLAIIVLLLGIAIQLNIPVFISAQLDKYAASDEANLYLKELLILSGLVILFCLFNSLRFFMFEKIGDKIAKDLKRDFFQQILAKNMPFFDSRDTNILATRLFADIEFFKTIFSTNSAIFIRSILVSVGAIYLMFSISWQLSSLLLILAPTFLFIGKYSGKSYRNNTIKIQSQRANAESIAINFFSHIKAAFAFNYNDKMTEVFDTAIVELQTCNNKNNVSIAFYSFVSTAIGFLFVLVIIAYGIQLVTSNLLSPGELASFAMYSAMASSSIGAVASCIASIMRASGAMSYLLELKQLPQSESKTDCYNQTITAIDSIELNHTAFSYVNSDDKLIFSHGNIEAGKGDKVGLIGESGSGKSTIVDLLLGLYFAQKGQVLINHKLIDTLTLDSLRSRVSVVFQGVSLFPGSLRENLSLSASLDDICYYTSKLGLHEKISNLENGYESDIEIVKNTFSGGQLQRLMVARAFIKDFDVLILDEATSALDAVNEELINQVIDTEFADKIVIVISHRKSQLNNLDKLYQIIDGKIRRIELDDPLSINNLSLVN